MAKRKYNLTKEQVKLVKDNIGLVYGIINKIDGLNKDLEDDIVQDLFEKMCKAATLYKPDMGVKFSTYVFKCICHKPIELKYRYGCPFSIPRGYTFTDIKKMELPSSFSIDAADYLPEIIADSECCDVEYSSRTHNKSLEKIKKIIEKLPADARYVLDRVYGLNGKPVTKLRYICKQVNRSSNYASVKLKQTLKIIRRRLEFIAQKNKQDVKEYFYYVED